MNCHLFYKYLSILGIMDIIMESKELAYDFLPDIKRYRLGLLVCQTYCVLCQVYVIYLYNLQNNKSNKKTILTIII